jgi:hypothetical protein
VQQLPAFIGRFEVHFKHSSAIRASRSHTRAGVATEVVRNPQQIRGLLLHLPAIPVTLARYGVNSSCPLNPEPRILSGVYHRVV